jgi:predicted DNA binding CopG/RHH family protein
MEEKSKFQEAMGGNVPKREKARSINIQFTESVIEEIERRSLEEDIPRNKYLSVAMEHYWNCPRVK